MRMFPHQGLFALYEQSYYLRLPIAIRINADIICKFLLVKYV